MTGPACGGVGGDPATIGADEVFIGDADAQEDQQTEMRADRRSATS